MTMRKIESYVCTLCGYGRSKPWTGKCPSCRDGESSSWTHNEPTPTARLSEDTPEFRAAMTGGSPENHRRVMERRG